MRILLIGGTGFTGPAVVSQLMARGHDVTVLHRGQTTDALSRGATEILVDRKDGERLTSAIASASPDVVVDMIPFTASDADAARLACRAVASRIVALSSIDVYLAFGRIQKTEPGPLQPTPLTETSDLRQTNQPNGSECDKLAVERSYLSDDGLPCTVLRLPAIYGARDRYRRFRGYLKRMDDGRDTILLGRTIAAWKFSRGYVDNVAHAVCLTIENDSATNEVFNVAEPDAMTELAFVQAIGQAAGWEGDVKVMPDDQLPPYLQPSVNFEQNWDVDTSKIRSRLGYSEIVDVAEAFRRTVEWERANPPEVEPFEYKYDQEDDVLAGTGDN